MADLSGHTAPWFCHCWPCSADMPFTYRSCIRLRLRSTGTGFCYNVARYLTAAGVFFMGSLTVLFASLGFEEPFRWATVSVALIYLGGLAVLPIAPETKDQPLPD